MLTGCAVNRPEANSSDADLGPHQYVDAAASALAFDAPVAAAYPLPGLDRSDREPGAFLGYDESSTEYYSIGMIDNQSNDLDCDYYNRWSYTERVGTRIH